MFNGADIVGFIIVFGGGFLLGNFFGVMIASLMHVSSIDSRNRERMEENDEGKV